MKKTLVLFGMFVLFAFVSNAQNFVYTPKNPSFGGNTFNYHWMLSSAQAQNITKDPLEESKTDYFNRDPVEDFKESLNRQILSRLSRELIDNQFGEDALSPGTYELGDYNITVGNSDEGISVNIVDNKTGATTDVTVPYF